jgi:hypothetical protein
MADEFEGPTSNLSEIGGHWDPRPVHYHGAGELNRIRVAPGRKVAWLPGVMWPNTPEECTADHLDTSWVANGKVLLCNGCGIDAT